MWENETVYFSHSKFNYVNFFQLMLQLFMRKTITYDIKLVHYPSAKNAVQFFLTFEVVR